VRACGPVEQCILKKLAKKMARGISQDPQETEESQFFHDNIWSAESDFSVFAL
jgi:hypothetical protein